MLAALTGATGFLGVHLVRALDAAGYQVRVLARREPSPPGWGDVSPEIVKGDLSDPAALERLVEGAAVVVHCAGAIKGRDLMAVNRDGAARLAQAVLDRAPDAHVVLVSSLAARSPEISAYGASKRAGESAVSGLIPLRRLTIVRPPAIYGPGDRETLTLFQAAATSPVLPVLSKGARMALMHVEDVAAHIAVLAGRDPTGATYALGGDRPEGLGWRELMGELAAAAGTRPLLAPIPPALLRFVAGAGEAISRLNRRPALLTADKVGEFLHPDWAVDRSEMADDLPSERRPLKAGFASTVSWYRDAGWLR